MRAWSMFFVLFISGLAGCAGTTSGPPVAEAEETFIEHLARASFDTTGVNSVPLEEGPFSVLGVERVSLASHDGTQLTAALWRPDVPEGTQVPVILMISPYFSTGLFNVDSRTGELFHRFVEHGYAFAKVAVRGTSHSDGCMESFSLKEQQDMDDIVTHFGQAEWSNGNVGIIGVSYVGSTPWAAATHENDHLKTIVPISGVTDWFQLGFRNGSREPRTPIHMPLYWGNYGVPDKVLNVANGDGEATAVAAQLCEEFAWGVAASEYSVATGDDGDGRIAQYWADRDVRERVAANYNGSIFLVHGLQDWNVNADMAVPFVTDLQKAGVEVKWLLGQWGHSWPDAGHDHRRWDFAEQLLRWFDVHLKGHDLDTGAVAEVEDSSGLWRIEDTWPPADANWTRWYMGDGSLASEPGAAGSAFLVNPGGLVDPEECTGAVETVPGTEARFRTAPMEEELRFAGMPRVHVTVAPADARGGHLYAELLSEAPGGALQRLIHGTMNLRFHAGGEEPQTIVPGQEIVARMELFPMDAVVPEGNRLVLRLVPDASIEPCASVSGQDVIQRPKIPGPDPLPLRVFWGEGSVVDLPVIVREVEGSYPGQPS